MAHWISGFATVSYRLDQQRFLTLSSTGPHNWHFQIWGPEPFMTEFQDLTLEEAIAHAGSVASHYFRHTNRRIKLPSFLQWCAAVTVRKYIS
jgi:hypothetical protein